MSIKHVTKSYRGFFPFVVILLYSQVHQQRAYSKDGKLVDSVQSCRRTQKKYSVRFYELRYFHELRSFMSSEQTALCSSNIVIINNQSGAISKDQPNPSCCLFGKLINWASDAGLLSLLLKFHSVVFMLPIANSLHFYAFG